MTKRIGAVIGVGIVGGLTIGLACVLLAKRWRLPQWLPGVVTAFITSLTSVLVVHVVWRGPLQAQIRRELNERGIPLCIRCGYNLTGLTQPRCPECGTPFPA
jgi:fructose-specific phosphotransferase system IIC component